MVELRDAGLSYHGSATKAELDTFETQVKALNRLMGTRTSVTIVDKKLTHGDTWSFQLRIAPCACQAMVDTLHGLETTPGWTRFFRA